MKNYEKGLTVDQYVEKAADFLDISIYSPMEAFEHGFNTGNDWNDDKLQQTINERDELQKQVVSLENEIAFLIHAQPVTMSKHTQWQSVANVPIGIQVIHLDTMTGKVSNVKYIRQPDKDRADRYYWIDMPLTHKTL